MRLDQLCFYCGEDWQITVVKDMFGLQSPWIEDNVRMLTRIPPDNNWSESEAKLMFNERLGLQLEIMQWVAGPAWVHPYTGNSIFISHIGLHLDTDEDWPDMPELVQESKTISHTASAFHDTSSPQYGRRYHYRIHRLPYSGNVYLKLIRRLHADHRQDT